jgi:hypothetical protein
MQHGGSWIIERLGYSKSCSDVDFGPGVNVTLFCSITTQRDGEQSFEPPRLRANESNYTTRSPCYCLDFVAARAVGHIGVANNRTCTPFLLSTAHLRLFVSSHGSMDGLLSTGERARERAKISAKGFRRVERWRSAECTFALFKEKHSSGSLTRLLWEMLILASVSFLHSGDAAFW